MHRVHTDGKVQVTLDLKRKELDIRFPLTIDDRSHNFCFDLPVSQLSHVYQAQEGSASSVLIIPFERPPQFFIQKRPTMDEDSSFSKRDRIWNAWSTWYRETDVVGGQTRRLMQTLPLMNPKGSAIIDIGMSADFSIDLS